MMQRALVLFPEKGRQCLSSFSDPVLLIQDPGDGFPIRVTAFASEEALEDSDSSGLVLQNEGAQEVQVLAIDKCLIQDKDVPGQGRCEGLFVYESTFCWFEIKNRKNRGKARREAYGQLEDTVKDFFHRNLAITDLELYAAVALLGKQRRPAASTASVSQRLHFLETYNVTLLEGNQYSIPINH